LFSFNYKHNAAVVSFTSYFIVVIFSRTQAFLRKFVSKISKANSFCEVTPNRLEKQSCGETQWW